MLVAPGVEFGDARKAAMGQLPQVIGNIQTAIGCVTIRRANGMAVQVMVGDPVCRGDAIETGADGRIEIRFIDGTVFSLSRDTCVVLSDFPPNAKGSPRSALFMPVGSIRSRTQAGGIGVLSLAALTFSLLKEAQAADPNVTFLDDDSITYKDLGHGVFELVTKEAIPRHIIVDDPGETVVLTRRESSVGVNQVANTPERMEELQAAQQDVLANFAKGLGSKGSGATPFEKLLPTLQPINFTQPDLPTEQKSFAPLEGMLIKVPDLFIVNLPPTLNLGAGPTEIDTMVFDTFNASSGTFSASSASPNGASLTFGISGGVAGNTVLGGATYDVSATGAYGTLYLNSTTGAYTFVPNNDAINALKSNTTQSFVITASDGSLSVDQTFSINITGANDAAVISGTTNGSVVGAAGVAAASPGLLIATGTLTDTDVDDPANTFTAVSSPAKSTGGFGTFTITAGGVWTYTLDDANAAVEALKVGGTLTDTFTVTTIGGTPQVVTITVHGPLIGATGTAPSLMLSETHLTATALDGNIAGSAPDAALTTTWGNFSTAFTSVQGADGATISYGLTITGGNGTASGLIDSHTGLADVLVLNGNTIEGHVGTAGGTLAFTITLDPATGLVSFTEYRPVTQPFGTNPDSAEGMSLTAGIVNLVATITDKNGDFQAASLDLGKLLTITDDGPSITATGTAPSLMLSETHLTATALDGNIAGSAPDAALTTTSANFSTAFSSVQGADGATISYALTIKGGNGTASGLIDSHTGLADVLVLNGNTIEGHVGTTGGTLAFTITLDPATGLVTFTDYRPVTQPLGTNPDGAEGMSLTAGIVNLVATITDKDGDFQAASLDLGKLLTITDDGPSITATGTAPSLTLSETHLTATALDGNIAGSAPDAALTTTSANFSTAFTSVQGADGATISYGLTITGGNGTASGLIDSHTGLADILVLNGNTIEGHVGTAGGTLAFTITLDPATGLVSFTDYCPVMQPLGTNPDSAEGMSLTAGIVNLVATITDKDGDFQAASLDLGKLLTITDDGPTIGQFEQAIIAAQDNQIANGTYSVNFGADGEAAMLVAVNNGAVGSTGYNLATSSLGDGITSVHVTGNGDDYTFYYTTHAVSGGVELDAYLTDTSGTVTDPYFTLLINPDGTYSFDLESVELLKEVTVAGSDFGASGGGTLSLTAPDGQLVITGSDNSGHPLDVKASNNGIAVGDTGLQMDPNEDLNLTFSQQQSQVSFILTQWQGNGTADVIFKVLDSAGDIHDFNINIPKPSGGIANIVVQQTSDASLIGTYTFDSTTSTYTLYVGQAFNQIQVDYYQAATGNATFTINNIAYNEKSTIPSTDLLFDVSAVDTDGDSATTSLQVDLQGSTTGATGLSLTATPNSALTVSGGGTDTTATISSPTTGSTTTLITTDKPTYTSVDNTSDAAVRSRTNSERRYGTLPTKAAAAWAATTHNNGAVKTPNVGDMLTDTIIGGFGALLLTGSNGIAAPASSVADSTITDFVSGFSKIDLTALGSFASAILHLTSTSTFVPAHTIAWLYDNETNQAVVYVNPTDQPLGIGASGLVAIHLPGVASVQLSDFALAPTTGMTGAADGDAIAATTTALDSSDPTAVMATKTDDSSDTSVSHSVLSVDWDWTAHTTNIHYSSDATNDGVDDTAAALPNGLSIQLPYVAATAVIQTGFAFDDKPVFDAANVTTIGHGAAMHGPGLPGGDWIVPPGNDWKVDPEANSKNDDHEVKNVGALNADDTHGHEIDTNPNVVPDSGVLETPESGGLDHSIAGEAGEHGAATSHHDSVHDSGPSSLAQVQSGGTADPPGEVAELNHISASMSNHEDTAGTHGSPAIPAGEETQGTLGDAFHFKDEISSSKGSGTVGVAGLDQIPASAHHEDAANHGPPAISEEAQAIELQTSGQHSADASNFVPDHAQSALVTHAAHDLIV